jgi:hypothetical protein
MCLRVAGPRGSKLGMPGMVPDAGQMQMIVCILNLYIAPTEHCDTLIPVGKPRCRAFLVTFRSDRQEPELVGRIFFP